MQELPASASGHSAVEVARLCAREAGRIIMAHFGRHEQMVAKGRGNFVTEADLAAERGVLDLLEELRRDRPFYEASGGGVTFSGGEPVLHAAFLRELLPHLASEGLHVAIETSGQYPWSLLEGILPWIDLVLFDLKLMDPVRHRALTEHDNVRIHENLRRVLASGVPVEVRMPVVPGRNTDEDNVSATARFLAQLGVPSLTLLPYNPLWEAKLPRLGTGRKALGIAAPGEAFYTDLRQRFERAGVATRL